MVGDSLLAVVLHNVCADLCARRCRRLLDDARPGGMRQCGPILVDNAAMLLVLGVCADVGVAVNRNPLHAVAGSARFILERCEPGDDMYDDVTTILSGTREMSNLITSLMDWTNVNSEKAEVTTTSIALRPVVRTLVRAVASGMPTTGSVIGPLSARGATSNRPVYCWAGRQHGRLAYAVV